MQYWKLFTKSGDPNVPDLIFRHCEPAIDERHCIERWDGQGWIDDSAGPYHLEDFLYGEAGARAITEDEANGFISTK